MAAAFLLRQKHQHAGECIPARWFRFSGSPTASSKLCGTSADDDAHLLAGPPGSVRVPVLFALKPMKCHYWQQAGHLAL
jgi:hypothetical protein